MMILKKMLPLVALTFLTGIYLSGCSSIKISPSSGLDVLALNQIDNTSSILIISQELQEKVYSSKPSFGVGYSARTFDIHIGKPLSDHVYRQLKELLPNVKLEPQISDLNYDIIIDLSLVDIEFGRLKEPSYTGLLIPEMFGEVVSAARVSINADISGVYGTHNLVVSGEGNQTNVAFMANKKSIVKAIEKAIMDLSRKLAMCVEEIIKTPHNKRMQSDTLLRAE